MSKDALDGWRVDGKITATEQATQPGDVPILDSTGKIPDELIDATALTGHTSRTDNPHAVTKAQVGLGAYPASPADIGISTATQSALNGKADATALTAHTSRTDNPHAVTKAQVGLGAYPASPADIGISTATQTALDGKADATALTAHTSRTDNPHAVTKAQVGLGAYPTSPADIGISTATQSALNAKADVSALETKADVSALETKADKSELEAKADKMVLIGTHDIPKNTSSLDIGTVYWEQRVYVEIDIGYTVGFSSSGSGVLSLRQNDDSSIFFAHNESSSYGLFRLRFKSSSTTCVLQVEQLQVSSSSLKWARTTGNEIRVRVYAMD